MEKTQLILYIYLATYISIRESSEHNNPMMSIPVTIDCKHVVVTDLSVITSVITETDDCTVNIFRFYACTYKVLQCMTVICCIAGIILVLTETLVRSARRSSGS